MKDESGPERPTEVQATFILHPSSFILSSSPRGRRPDLHRHRPVYETGAFLGQPRRHNRLSRTAVEVSHGRGIPTPRRVLVRHQEAGVQGVEPCGAVLEAACSPGSTPLDRPGEGVAAAGRVVLFCLHFKRPPGKRAGRRTPLMKRTRRPRSIGCATSQMTLDLNA